MDNFLSIKEAVQRYSASCDGKIKTPFDKLFIKAMLAGMMIAMGAAGSSVACHAIGNVGLARLVAGVVFPVGLMMVILTGAELFTGDCLMIVATVEKKNTMAQMIKELVFIYIGNFVGAALLALGVYFSGQLGYSSNLLGAYTIKVAVGKTVKVKKLTGEGPVKRRIMDMGITKGVDVFVRKVAPLGDPVEVTVRGYELSLRKADAEMIEVE